MATHIENPRLDRDIQTRLSQLRRQIRIYVWLEGLSLALVWLGLTYWIGLAIDYLPVLAGASELPRGARLVLLLIIATVLAYVLYRWILRRAFIRLPDRSMAVLLERHYGQFHDSLVTAVELAEQPQHAVDFNHDMLARTREQAHDQVAGIRVNEVFRIWPLLSKVLMATVALASIGIFCATNLPAATTWAQRLYLLADQPWPRSTRLEVAGIQIQYAPRADGEVLLSDLIPFDANREIKVAQGTSVLLEVQADAAKVIPEYCTVYYRTEEGDRGSATMQKRGRIFRDAESDSQYQMFVCDSKPFRGILSTITFDVRGLDHRVRNYRLTVVPNPVIVQTKLDCEFPSYMVNEQLSLWLPRTIDFASGSQLPVGTRVALRCEANKDLTKVVIQDVGDDTTTTLKIPPQEGTRRSFTYVVDSLPSSLALDITLHDADGVVSDPPIRLSIDGIEDQPPEVKARLQGIGTAVTPDVVIPVTGEIVDDYDVDRSWFDVIINDGTPREYPFPLGPSGELDARLDFRAERSGADPVTLQPQDKVSVALMASDRCDVASGPNTGSGDRYQLDVVTPEQLLAMLERKELGLRRRLEQIIDELSEMRDNVSRLRTPTDSDQGEAPEDNRQEPPADQSAEQTALAAQQRARSLRLLRAQRAIAQCDKSAQEVLGVAASFSDIRDELVNNRVDSTDRESRIQEQIAEPLRLIGESMFPVLNDQLQDVEQKLDDPPARDQATDLAVEQADNILLELDKVLQKILELETFNELMNIVRSLIADQEELIERTKDEQKKGALDLLR